MALLSILLHYLDDKIILILSYLIGVQRYGGSYKVTYVRLYVCLFVHRSVQHFSQELLIRFFSDFLHFFGFLKNFVISFSWKQSKIKTNIVIDISSPVPFLAKIWLSSYGPKCCQPIKLQDSLKCNISRKKWMMKFILGMQIKVQVLYKLTLLFLVCVDWYA